MSLEEWVEQRYARRVVVVESSPAADAVCGRSGLDLIHLLRPHSVYTGGPLYARTGDRSEPAMCSRFGVRLMRTECVKEVALAQLLQHTRRLLRNSAAIDLAYGEQLDRALREIVQKGRRCSDGSLPRVIRVAQPASSTSSSASVASGGPASVLTLLERACPTWHPFFIRDFHYLARCNSNDTIDHPIGAIFAVATTEAGGIEGILQVFQAQAKRVHELRASIPGMRAELHHYYLILHDNSSPNSPSLSAARNVLTAVQQLYGANYCALIKVNSVVDPRAVKNLNPASWIEASPAVMDVPSAQAIRSAVLTAAATGATGPSSAVAATSPNTPAPTSPPRLSFRALHSTCGTWPHTNTAMLTGCYLSPEDVEEVRNVMAYYLSQSLFKFVERSLRGMDVSVQDRRTTTLGKVTAWLKGKDEGRPRPPDVVLPPSGSDRSVQPQYVAQSLPMQMRCCADLSLSLHDFDGAVSYYRMCVEELLETLSQRPYNRAFIAACQEGIGVAQYLQGKLAMPSVAPWYVGVTSATQRISSKTNRWEVAWNDYLAAGTQPMYAARVALLLYESSRMHTPPLLDRCSAILAHLQRSGVLQSQSLLKAIVSDMLAGAAIFSNPPFPAGMATPSTIQPGYPVRMFVRHFVQHLQQAGACYMADNSLEQALRCYLRVLEVLRLIDPTETWHTMMEHLYQTVGRLYMLLGQDVRGIAMLSAAVARGTPLYHNPVTAQTAFETLWGEQKRVLSAMSYALCPHMPVPLIARGSFQVDRNAYNTDLLTDDAARRMGEAAAEAEWLGMEKELQRSYVNTVLKTHSRYFFPAFQGGRRDGKHGGVRGRRLRGDVRSGSSSRRSSTIAEARGGEPPSLLAGRGPHTATRYGDGLSKNVAVSIGAGPLQRHCSIAYAEPLLLSFVMENTLGCPVEAAGLTLLYLSYAAPEQLWKSSTTQTVRLEPGARQRVSLSFDPVAEGEYAIIGLSWTLQDQEGYFYFATRESRTGNPESLYEYAMENPMPALDAPENIRVTVTPPKACVAATFQPPLPVQLYDGEYVQTNLVVQNTSTKQEAAHVMLQRGSSASHLFYMEDFSLAQNCDVRTPLLLAEQLRAGESRTFAVTVRAQHRRGDTARQSSPNCLFLLFAYLPSSPSDAALPPNGSLVSTPELDATISATSTPLRHRRGSTGSGSKAPGGPLAAVRLHRLLRRCEVQPVVNMHTTVLPPSNSSLRAAIVLTVKNISPKMGRVQATTVVSAAAHPTPPLHATTARAVQVIPKRPCADDALQPERRSSDKDIPSSVVIRIARVLAVHSPRWAVESEAVGERMAEGAMKGALAHGESLTLPLLVKRRPRLPGMPDTTAREVFCGSLSSLSSGAADVEDDEGSPYMDTTCLPLNMTLPSPATVTAVEAALHASVTQSRRNMYFLRSACLGPGNSGTRLSSEKSDGSLAFYADGAGQLKELPKSAKQLLRDKMEEERRLCGGPIEQYTPLAIAVTWVCECEGGADFDAGEHSKREAGSAARERRQGQVFLFVDPIQYVYQTFSEQQLQGERERQEEVAVTSFRRTRISAEVGVSVEQQQQELCKAMLTLYSSLKPWYGAVVSHVHVPPIVRARKGWVGEGEDGCLEARVPVTLRCLSLAPVPLLVTAEALPPSVSPHPISSALGLLRCGMDDAGGGTEPSTQTNQSASPLLPRAPARSDPAVLFVGKTVHTFLLMPSEEYEMMFVAVALRLGLVDCQRITLSATPVCFLPNEVECATGGDDHGVPPRMHTGMTRPALIRAFRTHKTPSPRAPSTARVVAHGPDQRQGVSHETGDGAVGTGMGLSRPSGGRPPVSPCESALAWGERLGGRAADVVRQLAPLDAAGGVTVFQVIAQATPALTRVVEATPDSRADTNSEAPSAPPNAAAAEGAEEGGGGGGARDGEAVSPPSDTARVFFQNLERFEVQRRKAASANPSDPYAERYLYRPTVKTWEARSVTMAYHTDDNSFAMQDSFTRAASVGGAGGAPGQEPSNCTASTVAKADRDRRDGTHGIPRDPAPFCVKNFFDKMNVPSATTANISPRASASSTQSSNEGADPASPLHLPAVAFRHRAGEAAITLDVDEGNSAMELSSRVGTAPLDAAHEGGCQAETEP